MKKYLEYLCLIIQQTGNREADPSSTQPNKKKLNKFMYKK